MTLDQKKKQLKNLKQRVRISSMCGKFGWGEYHMRQHIKELEKEIRQEQSLPDKN